MNCMDSFGADARTPASAGRAVQTRQGRSGQRNNDEIL